MQTCFKSTTYLEFKSSRPKFLKYKQSILKSLLLLCVLLTQLVYTVSYSQESNKPLRFKIDVETLNNNVFSENFYLADTLFLYALEGIVKLSYFQDLSSGTAMELEPQQSQFILCKMTNYPYWDENSYFYEGDMIIYDRKIWQSTSSNIKSKPSASSLNWSLVNKGEYRQVRKIEFLEFEFESDLSTIKYVHAFGNPSRYLCSFDGSSVTRILKHYLGRPNGDIAVGKLFAPVSTKDFSKTIKDGEITDIIIRYDKNNPVSIKFSNNLSNQADQKVSKILSFDKHNVMGYKSYFSILLEFDQWNGGKLRSSTQGNVLKLDNSNNQLNLKVWESPNTNPSNSFIFELLTNPLFFGLVSRVINRYSSAWDPKKNYGPGDRVHDRNLSFFVATQPSFNRTPGMDADSSRNYWDYTQIDLILQFVIRYDVKVGKTGNYSKTPDQFELKLSADGWTYETLGVIDIQQLKSIELNMKSESQEFIRKYLLQQSGEYKWKGCSALQRSPNSNENEK